ncbi:MAG: hypothetical protein QOD14_914 [Solirubrobacterales bacterium]|nr:hypothetical protein [Solirubrobacterales bacterium]
MFAHPPVPTKSDCLVMTDDQARLHPAEHRAYRELYASTRHLIHRWGRLARALEGTGVEDVLRRGVSEAESLLEALKPRTEDYGLHGGPMAQGVGARFADVRSAVVDRGADTGMVVRFAVLDAEHLTTLLRQLAELARARQDRDLAGFCEEWAGRFESQLDAVREAAVELGTDPDRVAAPVDDSLVNRAAHGVGWVFGAAGEGIDQIAGRRRRS